MRWVSKATQCLFVIACHYCMCPHGASPQQNNKRMRGGRQLCPKCNQWSCWKTPGSLRLCEIPPLPSPKFCMRKRGMNVILSTIMLPKEPCLPFVKIIFYFLLLLVWQGMKLYIYYHFSLRFEKNPVFLFYYIPYC